MVQKVLFAGIIFFTFNSLCLARTCVILWSLARPKCLASAYSCNELPSTLRALWMQNNSQVPWMKCNKSLPQRYFFQLSKLFIHWVDHFLLIFKAFFTHVGFNFDEEPLIPRGWRWWLKVQAHCHVEGTSHSICTWDDLSWGFRKSSSNGEQFKTKTALSCCLVAKMAMN